MFRDLSQPIRSGIQTFPGDPPVDDIDLTVENPPARKIDDAPAVSSLVFLWTVHGGGRMVDASRGVERAVATS